MKIDRAIWNFLADVQNDPVIGPIEICVYTALLCVSAKQRYVSEIRISRESIKRICKITSNTTYHKSMKILQSRNHIIYRPSYNPIQCSKVILCNLIELENE